MDKKVTVQGLHSASVEPLNSILWNSFQQNWEKNTTYQLQFTAYDDGSVAFAMLDGLSTIIFDGQKYIVKQCLPDYQGGVTTKQITALHDYNEIIRVRQRNVKTGTLTYSVADVLSFYLSNNQYGFTYQVIGDFEKRQITDLGNSSGKDMLTQIVSTWPEAVIYPDNRNIRVYNQEDFTVNKGNRIDYLHDTNEVQITYDFNSLVNQVMVYGKQKENTDTDKTQYYFEPHLVKDQKSIDAWGLYEGDDVSDERFTNSAEMDKYALTQMASQPTLTITVKYSENIKPTPGEIRRLEIREKQFVTNVEVVAFTWYPFDNTQPTDLTLNNTAKTILDYKNSNNKELKQAIADQKEIVKSVQAAGSTANKAYESRIGGTRVDTGDVIPGLMLRVPADNADLGLLAGQEFYVKTRADLVDGLADVLPIYDIATDKNNGLMSADDKVKLDAINDQTLLLKSPSGSSFLISVDDEGQLVVEKQEVENGN